MNFALLLNLLSHENPEKDFEARLGPEDDYASLKSLGH